MGALMAEYFSTFRPIWALDDMLQLREKYSDTELNMDNATEALYETQERLTSITGRIAACMFFYEILNHVSIAINEPEAMIEAINEPDESGAVEEVYLKPAGIDDFSIDNLGDALYTAYYFSSISYVMFSACMEMILSISDEEAPGVESVDQEQDDVFSDLTTSEKLDRFMQFYVDEKDMQNIACRVVLHGRAFVHEYEVTNSLSLLLFDFANAASHKPKTVFCVCKNCGRIFVPTGRADTKYCYYASPQDKTKTCSEIGPQIARARKIETDKATHEYRKLYMRLKMQAKRHPDEARYMDFITKLVAEGKEWRKRLEEDTESMGEYYDWLASFERSSAVDHKTKC